MINNKLRWFLRFLIPFILVVSTDDNKPQFLCFLYFCIVISLIDSDKSRKFLFWTVECGIMNKKFYWFYIHESFPMERERNVC